MCAATIRGQVGADHRRRGLHRVRAGAPGARLRAGDAAPRRRQRDGAVRPRARPRGGRARRRACASGSATSPTARRWTTIFQQARPDVVFHAAAYKHIPVMEEHPDAALRANVVGTLNVCARRERCRRGEGRLRLDRQGGEPGQRLRRDEAHRRAAGDGDRAATAATTFAAVRFGNVMGSRGSVVPLFLRQIERGGPVLLTDPETTRFQMAVEEAASLVIQAASFAEQGQIFILDMGEPIRTADLAEKMIRLKGLEPGRDIQIVYTGLRPGEKLHEELIGVVARSCCTRTTRRSSLDAGHARPSRATSWSRKIEELAHDRRRAVARGDWPRACTRSPASTCATRASATSDAETEPSQSARADSSERRRRLHASPTVIRHEDPHRRRRAAAVRQGGARSRAPCAQRHTEILVHTGQHYDPQHVRRLLRRAGAAAARPPPRRRLRHARRADGADAGAARGRDAARGAGRASSSTATRTARSPARSPPRSSASRSRTSRPGCAASSATCRRRSTASSPTTSRPTSSRRRRPPSTTCAREGHHVDGRARIDRRHHVRRAAAARRRSPPSARRVLRDLAPAARRLRRSRRCTARRTPTTPRGSPRSSTRWRCCASP